MITKKIVYGLGPSTSVDSRSVLYVVSLCACTALPRLFPDLNYPDTLDIISFSNLLTFDLRMYGSEKLSMTLEGGWLLELQCIMYDGFGS